MRSLTHAPELHTADLDDDAPAEPEPTGPTREDEAWWSAYCQEREEALERRAREQPTEEDWADMEAACATDDRRSFEAWVEACEADPEAFGEIIGHLDVRRD